MVVSNQKYGCLAIKFSALGFHIAGVILGIAVGLSVVYHKRHVAVFVCGSSCLDIHYSGLGFYVRRFCAWRSQLAVDT